MATITGTSSSCMGRISTEENSTSFLTLDTRADLAGEFQILPRLALVARRAQEIGGMIGHDQRHLGESEAGHLLAQPPQTPSRIHQALRRDPSPGPHTLHP